MPGKEPDFFQLRTGKKFEEIERKVPTFENILERRVKEIKSHYPIRPLGLSQDGEVYITEEERESHLHILGTTGEGKSRFIEHLIRGDIAQGNGVCLLDPTDRADTAYNILRYCASIGFEKVCLIDPHTLKTHGRITAIQPFHREPSYKTDSVSNLMDTVRILFQTKDAAETPRIQRYLPALLNVLWNARMTLHEAVYFSEFKLSRPRRQEILEHSHPLDRHKLAIEEVFETYPRFDNQFGSTVRRMEPFFDSTLDLMFGADTGVDFAKMISEGWVILVNLDAEGGMDPLHTRLLGTAVINELLFAMYRLRSHGFKRPYYLYIDEAGQYVNDKLIRILEYKRKSGFRVTLAHQGFFQFPVEKAKAVKQLCKIKVMFHTPDHADRLEMVKALGYGGEIPHEMANYANKNIPKQYAVVALSKQDPVRIKIPDVSDVNLSKEAEQAFIGHCLLREWNYTPREVREQMKKRFNDKPSTNTRPPKERTPPNRKAASGSSKRPKTVFDLD